MPESSCTDPTFVNVSCCCPALPRANATPCGIDTCHSLQNDEVTTPLAELAVLTRLVLSFTPELETTPRRQVLATKAFTLYASLVAAEATEEHPYQHFQNR